eukprot:scpid18171/ scgid2366/ Transient receptor potential cation channel subfamily A member 1 homolog
MPIPGANRSIRLGSDAAMGTHIPLRRLAIENRQNVARLIKYTKLGNQEQVQEIVRSVRGRPNRKHVINGRDRLGLTALHYASKLNKAEIVELLIAANADVNRRSDDTDKLSAFHYICRWQSESEDRAGSAVSLTEQSAAQTLTQLIDHGAEINEEDNYGMTGLHHACQRGNITTVQILLEKWGDRLKIDAEDRQQQTPLHMAANHGNIKLVELLLNAGSDPFHADELGSLPIHLAAREGHIDTAKAMAKHVTKSQPLALESLMGAVDGEGGTILHEAVNNGNFEMVKFAFVNKVNPNTATLTGDTALHIAAGKGHMEIVTFLVNEAKAEIDAADESGNTPLHDAARLNREDVLLFLLKGGADIDMANADGHTPLMKAASWGQKRTVSALLEAGANVTHKDNEEKTVFWHAVRGNHIETVQVLSQDPRYLTFLQLADQFGNTALHLSASLGSLHLTELLISHGAVPDARNDEEKTPLHLAAANGHPMTCSALCRKNEALLEDEDESGNKPLHLAATNGHDVVVKVLLDLGAAVDGRNSKGWTPLDCAAGVGARICCQVLLEHDAPVDAKDKKNRTPLHIAARSGHTKIALLLLDHGADISHFDKTGRNCLDLAIDHQQEEVAEALVRHERWREALRNVSRSKLQRKGNRYQNTPLLKLIRRMPDVAQIVFTQCMAESQNVPVEGIDYKVTMDYEFIDYIPPKTGTDNDNDDANDGDDDTDVDDFGQKVETWTDWNPDRAHNHPLIVMVESNREALLAHPLVSTLLDYKWKKFIRYFYFIGLLLFSIYLAFITAFALTTEPARTGCVANPVTNATANATTSADCNGGSFRPGLNCPLSKQRAIVLCRVIIIAYSFFRFLSELVEAYANPSTYVDTQNLLDWVTHLTGVIFAWDFEGDEKQCVIENWQWQVGVVAVWLAWLSFISLQRRSGILGIYVVMFSHVFTTFAKMLAVIVLFVVAFGLAFFMLLDSFTPVIAFSNPGRALLKTAVSMTGEFEFDSTFNNEAGDVPFPGVSYFLWVCFLVIMPIILMNMLVGLAVDDIKGVQENARLSQLSMQVRLVLSIERRLPFYFHKKLGLNIPSLTISPNEPPSLRSRIKDYLFEDRLSNEKIQESLNPTKSELDRIEDQNRELRGQLKDLVKYVTDSQEQVRELRGWVRALCRQQDVQEADAEYI